MRPKTVILAERIYLASIVAMIAGALLAWDATVAQAGTALTIGLLAFSVGLSLLLLLLTTRRASQVALWFLVALTVVTAAGVLLPILQGAFAFNLVGAVSVLQLALVVVPTVLLFLPDSRAWFQVMRYDDEIKA